MEEGSLTNAQRENEEPAERGETVPMPLTACGRPVRMIERGNPRKTRALINAGGTYLRWRQVVQLHLAGHKAEEIAEITNYSQGAVYRILARPEAVELMQKTMDYYDLEFRSLYPEVISAVRRGLTDPEKYLDAAKTWLKSHGRMNTPATQGQINVTAEDVVFNILNQQAIESPATEEKSHDRTND